MRVGGGIVRSEADEDDIVQLCYSTRAQLQKNETPKHNLLPNCSNGSTPSNQHFRIIIFISDIFVIKQVNAV